MQKRVLGEPGGAELVAISSVIVQIARDALPLIHAKHGCGYADGGCLIFAAGLRRAIGHQVRLRQLSGRLVGKPETGATPLFSDRFYEETIRSRRTQINHVVAHFRTASGKDVFIDSTGAYSYESIINKYARNPKIDAIGRFRHHFDEIKPGEKPHSLLYDHEIVNYISWVISTEYPLKETLFSCY
jgi:hypothetical protein